MLRRRLDFVWRAMVKRCGKPSDPAYPRYGGRGISVAPEWANSFRRFLADMWPSFRDGLTLERVDNSAGYSLANCRWATKFEQQANTRKTLLLTHDGLTLPVREWARRTGLHHSVIARRIHRGLPSHEVLRRSR